MIDHSCLGKTTKIQERRYAVLTLLIKGAKPREIANLLSLSDNQVKNDIFHLTNTPLHNTTELMGLMNDKVEHTGAIKLDAVQIYIPDNGRNDAED